MDNLSDGLRNTTLNNRHAPHVSTQPKVLPSPNDIHRISMAVAAPRTGDATLTSNRPERHVWFRGQGRGTAQGRGNFGGTPYPSATHTPPHTSDAETTRQSGNGISINQTSAYKRHGNARWSAGRGRGNDRGAPYPGATGTHPRSYYPRPTQQFETGASNSLMHPPSRDGHY
jgi:hypothetical protein